VPLKKMIRPSGAISPLAYPESEFQFSGFARRIRPSRMVFRSLGFGARTVSSAVDEREAVCVFG
jgi:hypothetical protein